MGTRSKGQDNTFSRAFWEMYKDDALPGKHMGVSGSHIRAVLIGLAAHANYSDGKSIKVGQTRIARETCLSISTVKRAMAALVDLGWLIQTKEPTYTEPAHYNIILHGSVHSERSPGITESTDTGVTMNGGSVHGEQGEGSQWTGGSVHSELLPINTNQHQSVVEDAREDDDATNKPQHDVKDAKKPTRLERTKMLLATNDTEDMARGIYLIAKSCSYRLNEWDCSTIAFSLQFAEFSVEEIIHYLTEKIGYHHDKASNLLTSFIVKDASVWLLESRERARATQGWDGPTYKLMELPDELDEVKEPEPELTEEQKQKINDDFERMMREGIDPFAVRMRR